MSDWDKLSALKWSAVKSSDTNIIIIYSVYMCMHVQRIITPQTYYKLHEASKNSILLNKLRKLQKSWNTSSHYKLSKGD